MIFALALAASAAPSCDEIDPQAPVHLDLFVGGSVTPGAPVTLSVTGAIPGGTVGFALGDGENPDPCPAVVGGACLDLASPMMIGTAVADAGGNATIVGVIPASLSAYEIAFQAAALGCEEPALSGVLLVDVSMSEAEPCAFSPTRWSVDCQADNVGCFRDGWFSTVYPTGLQLGGVQGLDVPDALGVQDVFVVADEEGRPGAFVAALLALRLNLDFAAAGAFGDHVGLHGAQLPSGPHAGWTAADLVALAEATHPSEASASLVRELAWFDGIYGSCGTRDLARPTPTSLR